MIKLSPKLSEKITYDELQRYSRKLSRVENIIRYWLDRRYSKQEDLKKWLFNCSTQGMGHIYEDFEAQYPLYNKVPDKLKVKYALRFVKSNITYVKDSVTWKVSEKWQTPIETWELKKGDCEDGAILLYFILKYVGIEDNRMRIVAGDVKGGGHAYVVWLSNEDGLEYPVDWCYWFDKSNKMDVSYQDREDYFKGTKEWFSFNLKYSFKR